MSLDKSMAKLAVLGFLVVGWCGWDAKTALAQAESKTIALSVGEIQEVSVPFPVKGYRVVKPEVARAELMSEQKLRVVGLTEGTTDLQVTSEGGLAELFRISVVSSLDELLREIQRDIDDVPGVEAEKRGGKIILRGTVTKPDQWRRLKRELLPAYGDRVACKVVFKLQDEALLKIKADLEKAGLKVLEGSNKPAVPGVLRIECSGNLVFITGSVASRGEMETINSVISANTWLKTKRDDAKDTDDYCYAVLRVATTPVLLEVDVAFLGVTDDEFEQIGANIAKAGIAAFKTAASIGNRGSSSSWQVSTDLNGTLKATGLSGPGRFQSVGHLTFRNDAADWKTFHDGGTIQVPISGALSGNSIQAIDYGLLLKTKGGLVDAGNAALDLEVEFSVPVIIGESNGTPIYDLRRSRASSSVSCPIENTLILGGTKQLTEKFTTEGTPILGKIPLLSFLFSEKKSTRVDRRVLILISPQISRAPTAAPPAVEQTIGTVERSNQPVTNLGPKPQTR